MPAENASELQTFRILLLAVRSSQRGERYSIRLRSTITLFRPPVLAL